MKRFISITFAATAIFGISPASAGTQILGAELGVTTFDQLQNSLSKNTKVQNEGINKYSDGPMLWTDGTSYGIEGLNDVTYIFDKQQKLAGVLMTMDKDRFSFVYETLSKKYKMISNRRPFVGNQYALFKPSDANIEIDAPHLSFTMEVRYLRNDLVQQFNSKSAAESAAKKKSEAGKF